MSGPVLVATAAEVNSKGALGRGTAGPAAAWADRVPGEGRKRRFPSCLASAKRQHTMIASEQLPFLASGLRLRCIGKRKAPRSVDDFPLGAPISTYFLSSFFFFFERVGGQG